MIAGLQGLSGSPFARGVAALSGGQAVTMALPILAAPLLGRLYAPADYGFLALYMAIASILGVVGTLQYQTAIIAEPSLGQARLLVHLCLILGAGFTLLTVPAAALSWGTWLDRPAYLAARGWIFALPVTALAACFAAGMSTLANRHGCYRALATIPVVAMCVSVGVSILFGFLGWGVHGLMIGYLAGQASQAVSYVILWRALIGDFDWPRAARLRVLARRYRHFPIYALPGAFLSHFNMQLPVFALGAVGATQMLGQFSRARQLVSMPITLLGMAIAQVYRQQAAEQYRCTGTCRPLLLRTAGTLVGAGLLPCLGFMALAPQLFAIYLGEPWREAGEIARILAPMLLLRLMSTPIATTFFFTGRQKLDFALSVLSLMLVGPAVGLSLIVWQDPVRLVIAYSIALSAVYFIYLVASWKIAVRPEQVSIGYARTDQGE